MLLLSNALGWEKAREFDADRSWIYSPLAEPIHSRSSDVGKIARMEVCQAPFTGIHFGLPMSVGRGACARQMPCGPAANRVSPPPTAARRLRIALISAPVIPAGITLCGVARYSPFQPPAQRVPRKSRYREYVGPIAGPVAGALHFPPSR